MQVKNSLEMKMSKLKHHWKVVVILIAIFLIGLDIVLSYFTYFGRFSSSTAAASAAITLLINFIFVGACFKVGPYVAFNIQIPE